MNIAVNTRLLVPDKMDGIARFTYETLQLICKNHPEVNFTFIFDRKVDPEAFHFPDNVSFKTLPPPARHPVLWIIWFEFSIKNYINKNEFDLFLSPEGWIPPGLNCKSLGVIHDLNFEHHPENIIWSHRKYLQHYFPRYAKRADRIATVSHYSKNDIIETYSVPDTLIDVVYNGAHDIFKPLSEPEKKASRKKFNLPERYFIFISTLHPRKNLHHLFLAFETFRKKYQSENIQLVIAGNRKWWPDELEKTFQSLHYKNDIVFLGRLSDEDLNNVLAGATALTYLPYFEGFGIPILEAFKTETPVITANVTSMPEVANGAALLCSPTDTDEIARAMDKVVNSKSVREDLINKGKERANDFSWEKSAELLWESIKKTLR